MSEQTLAENGDGVHGLSVDNEFTLCGDALEGHLGEFDPCHPSDTRRITCARCVALIKHCRAYTLTTEDMGEPEG